MAEAQESAWALLKSHGYETVGHIVSHFNGGTVFFYRGHKQSKSGPQCKYAKITVLDNGDLDGEIEIVSRNDKKRLQKLISTLNRRAARTEKRHAAACAPDPG